MDCYFFVVLFVEVVFDVVDVNVYLWKMEVCWDDEVGVKCEVIEVVEDVLLSYGFVWLLVL